MVLWGIFAGVVVLMAWGGGGATVTGFGIVLLVAAPITVLLRHTFQRDHIPAFTATLVLASAYCPGAWQAIEKGFVYPIFASGDAVVLALLGLVVFIAVAVGVSRVSADWFARPAGAIEYLASAGRPGIGAVVIAILVVVSTVFGFRSGLWSHYGRLVKAEAGGVRLELLYFPLLFGFSTALGRTAIKEAISQQVNTKRAIAASAIWFFTITLLFIAQSRRIMLGALILTLASAWFGSSRISIIRAGFTAAALAGLGGILVIGSYLWRLAGPARSAMEHLRVISDSSVDVDELSKSFSDRLTYLWIDAASIEHYDALSGRFNLYEVATSTIIRATPALLMPEKYDTPKILCEHAYVSLGLRTDLPCTATTEGIIFGGIEGLFITALVFGIALGIVTALYRRGTFASMALAGAAMYPCVLIECSAFPIVDSLRVLAITFAFSIPLAWLLHLGDITRWIRKK